MRWRTPSVALATALALGLSVLTAPAALAATPDHSIAEVQGTGASTPLAGQTVTVEGVVTADYRGVSNFRGLFIQSASPAGIAGASDGLFVYLNQANPAVSIGDLVTVTGVAGENGGQADRDPVPLLECGHAPCHLGAQRLPRRSPIQNQRLTAHSRSAPPPYHARDLAPRPAPARPAR